MTVPGHNARQQLRSIIERIERLKDEQDALAADIREVYAEAKSNGYDKTALGQVVTIRRKRAKDPEGFEERNALVDLYLSVLDGTVDATRTHAHEDAPEATTSGKPSPEVGPQAEASPAGTGTGTPAGHATDSNGGGANAPVTKRSHDIDRPPPIPDFLRREPG